VAKNTGTPQEPLHKENVIGILMRQHERIREGFIEVKAATGNQRRDRFNELRALLAAHEAAEEMVLRPVSGQTAGQQVADARNREEREANRMLARLESLDVDSAEFDDLIREFQEAVLEHAASEESDEFPQVQHGRTAEELASMGRVLLAVEKIGPTRPHPGIAGSPTLQWTVGPFVSMLDRARDALSAALVRG
jgi:hemerythrin superfamily protein